MYRLLLLAFPKRVRREFGDEMTRLFQAQLAEARQAGRSPAALWAIAAVDALTNGFRERLVPVRTGARLARGTTRRWRWWMHALAQDVRYALRLLVRQPGITAIAVVTLALGIGANTAIFSAVNAVLLRPLPYDDPDRIMTLWEKRPNEGVLDNVVSPADFLDWAQMNTTFESMGAVAATMTDLTGSGDPARVFTGAVSPRFFDVFGTRMALGRTFRAEEAITGTHRVAILGHTIWRERFGGDPQVVGRTISLSGVPYEVIGVLPAAFEFPDSTLELWIPLAFGGKTPPPRASHYLMVYGKTKPGVTLEEARADLDRIGTQLQQQYPDTNRGHGAHVTSMASYVKTPIRSPLLLLLAAVGFVLLIACVNVANLLLAQAAARRREMALRAAVGAARARLAGQMITESVVLALLGGTAGLLVAWWSIAGLRQLAPAGQPVLGLQHLTLEPRVLAFALGLSLLTGLVFGVLPAWHLAGQDANGALKDGGRSPGGVRRKLRSTLVVSEIALASLLLIAAGLTVRSFQSLLNTAPGFQSSGVLTFNIVLPAARYAAGDTQVATFQRIEEKLAALPGVRSVGATSHLPLSGADARRGVGIEGREPTPDSPTRAHIRALTPGYIETMGITLKQGRDFTPADAAATPPVAIINETMARRYWGDTPAVGKRVRLSDDLSREVVGIVADVRHWGLDRPVNPELYLPATQFPFPFATFAVRTDGAPSSLASAVREQVRSVDPELPVSGLRTLDEVASISVASRRSGMLLLSTFGVLALTLAAAGIYGVMSHLVALRTAEIGIRMTLGAQPSAVMRLIVREGLVQAAAGLAIGTAGAILLMRGFRSLLFEVHPADPTTIAAVAALLLFSAAVAAIVPARRAMRVDPVQALRG